MNIEEVIERLSIAVAISKFETKDYPNCIVMKQDLRTLLTAYEKEKKKVSKYEKQLDLDYVEDNYTAKSLAKEKFKDTRKRILSQTIINEIDKYWMEKCLEFINNLEKELLEEE